MKSNYAKNVGGRLLTLLAILLFALYSGTASAQSGNLILTQGNVNIYQNADGWVIYHGNAVIAHGEGTLDITDLPPAFQDFLDYYAALSLDKSPKKKLSKAAPTPVQYGPLLRTQWNQTPPWNNMCPTIDLGAGSSEQSVIGCVSITSGQLLNYYKYCNAITVTPTSNTYNGRTYGENTYSKPFTNTNNSLLSANGTVTIEGETHYKYTYSIDGYQPNFDEINVDDNKLAEFMITLAVVQGADFDVSKNGGTGTTYVSQMNAMNDLYGYDAVYYDLHDANNKDNCYLSYGDRIKTAIEQGWPIIIRGQKNTDGSGGHSFMVDGIKGSEFHINYGWGGNGDGWFTEEATYKYDMGVVVSHPKNSIGMKASPASVHISGNGVNKTIEMVATGNGLEYRQEEDITLAAGEYEFYFEYSDGTKIAPYTDGKTIALTDEYSRLGYFVTTPAKFKISGNYNVNFWHLQNKGEIKIECADYNVALSGKVLDESSKGLAGVMIATSENKPVPEKDQYDEESNNYGTYLQETSTWYKRTFFPSKKCLSQVDVKLYKQGKPSSGVTVAILDKSLNILWRKHLADAEIQHNQWTSLPIEGCVSVEPGYKYFVALSVDEYDEDNYYMYIVNKSNEMLYRVYGTDEYFTTTDADGKYSMKVERGESGFTGTLYAFSDEYLTNPISISNATKSIDNLNFKALTKTITVSGKVLDASNATLQGVVVSTQSTIPQSEALQMNEVLSNSGYSVSNTLWETVEFTPTRPYLTQVDIMGWYKGNPGSITVAILDGNKNVIWYDAIPQEKFIQTYSNSKNWNSLEFGYALPVQAGQKYYVGLKANTQDDANYYVYSHDGNGGMNYRVYSCEKPFVTSSSKGEYEIEIDRYFSGSLYAIHDTKNFNSLTFSKLSANATNKDFKENGATVSYYGPLTVTEENGVKTAVIDGTSLETIEVENEIEVSSLKLERKFTAGVNTTIALPFEFNASNFSDGTFHTLKRVYHNGTEWIAELSPAITGTILANTPYIYQPGTSSTEVTFTNVKIEKTQELTVKPEGSDWELVTAYSKMEWNDKSKDYGYAASANDERGIKVGDFVRAGKGAWMRPMRCYLHYAGTDNTFSKSTIDLPQSIIVVIAEEEQEEEPQIVEEEQPQDVDSVEDDFATPISEIVATNKINVWSYEKTIFIEATAGQHYTIIDANGRMLLNSETTSDREEVVLNTKTSGMLIVRIANKSFKLKY